MMTTIRDSTQRDQPRGIYLDHQATAPPRPEVVQAVLEFMGTHFGNAGAIANGRGQSTRRSLEQFREVTASLIGNDPDALVFTSGATEGNNLIMSSEGRRPRAHIVISAIEHKCVIESALRTKDWGAKVSYLPVDRAGLIDLDALEKLVSQGATCVSIMAANNEIGTIQPVAEIARLCKREGVAFHTDAAQAIGKMPIDFSELGADYLTFTAHKFGGPQGIGGIVCKPQFADRLRPIMVGGGQERGLRSGTVPIALCAGLAAAARIVEKELDQEVTQMRWLRDRLLNGLSKIGPFFLNSSPEHGLCNNLNGGFAGISALALMRRIPEVHFSIGSACTTGAGTSHVLEAIGLPRERIDASFRLSLGWSTTADEIDEALVAFQKAVKSFGRGAIAGRGVSLIENRTMETE